MSRLAYGGLLLVVLAALQPVLVASGQLGPADLFAAPVSAETRLNVTIGDVVVVDGVSRLLFPLPNATGYVDGGGYVVVNESHAVVRADVDANVSIDLGQPIGQDMVLSILVTAEISGRGGVAEGPARVSINMSSPAMGGVMRFDLPLTVSLQWSEESARTLVSTDKGVLVMPQGSAVIRLRAETLMDYARNTTTTSLDLRIEADDPDTAMAAYMAVLMLLAVTGFPVAPVMKPPMYDPATGKYYIEVSTTRTVKMRGMGQPYGAPLEPGVRVDSLELSLALNASVTVSGTGARVLASFSLAIDASGDFSRGVPVQGTGLRARSMEANYTVSMMGESLLLETVFSSTADYGGDPVEALRLVQRLAESLRSPAAGVSEVVIRASGPIAVAIDGSVVGAVVLTPANATAVSRIGLLSHGAIVSVSGDRLVYMQHERAGPLVARLPAEGWRTVEVHVERTAVIQPAGPIAERVVHIVFPRGSVEIVFTSDATLATRTINVTVLAGPPKPLPEGYRAVSPIYDVSVELASGKALVKLYYTGEPQGELRVAHYRNGEWRLLTPVEVNTTGKYVVVEATSFSPLVVVELQPAQTPTQTTTTTTTAATETTTTSPTPTGTTTTATTTTVYEEEHEEHEEEYEEHTEAPTETTATTTTSSPATSPQPTQPAKTTIHEAEEEEHEEETAAAPAAGEEREAEEGEAGAPGLGGPVLFLLAVVGATLAVIALLAVVAKKRKS